MRPARSGGTSGLPDSCERLGPNEIVSVLLRRPATKIPDAGRAAGSAASWDADARVDNDTLGSYSARRVFTGFSRKAPARCGDRRVIISNREARAPLEIWPALLKR